MDEIHSSQNIIQWVDDNAGSKRKEETRLDKNELTDCAVQFCPFECDVLFQDVKNPYFLKAYLLCRFSHFHRIPIIRTPYSFQSMSDSDHMPLNNAYQLSKMYNKRCTEESRELPRLFWRKVIKYISSVQMLLKLKHFLTTIKC